MQGNLVEQAAALLVGRPLHRGRARRGADGAMLPLPRWYVEGRIADLVERAGLLHSAWARATRHRFGENNNRGVLSACTQDLRPLFDFRADVRRAGSLPAQVLRQRS